jgi:uncharacterized protein YjbJ (UPF0337 family)
MDKDRVKGKFDQTIGIAKRKTGELTGNFELEIEGMGQEIKGTLESAWGKAKDVVAEANKEAEVHHETRIEVAMECSAVPMEPEDRR